MRDVPIQILSTLQLFTEKELKIVQLWPIKSSIYSIRIATLSPKSTEDDEPGRQVCSNRFLALIAQGLL